MSRPPWKVPALLALSLLAGACTGSGPADGTGAPATGTGGQGPAVSGPGDGQGSDLVTGPAQVTGSDAVVVPELLRFETELVGGGSLRGVELAGAPVALWFWAPW
jgi:hypothetical protein